MVLTDVSDETSGQYTLEIQVFGPGGNVANIVNGQYMSVGGELHTVLAARDNDEGWWTSLWGHRYFE